MPEQPMVLIALGFAGFVVVLGGWGFLFPGSIVTFIRSWSSIGGMWLAVAMRLTFGAVLWLSAPLSRTELVFRMLAIVIAASGVVLPIFGYTRFRAFIEWWSKLPSLAMRLWCLAAVGLGGLLFWSVMQPIVLVLPESQSEVREASGSSKAVAPD